MQWEYYRLATVESSLDETVEMPAGACVEEEREPWVAEGLAVAEDETRRPLVDPIRFRVEEPAELGAEETAG